MISYQRPDVTGPKFSKYVMTPVSDTETMTAVLHMSNGMLGKVEKLRDVYIVQRNSLKARVHVDDVNQLGSYLEFEVITHASNFSFISNLMSLLKLIHTDNYFEGRPATGSGRVCQVLVNILRNT